MLTREARPIPATASAAAAEATRRSQRRSRRQYQTRATKAAAASATLKGARDLVTVSARLNSRTPWARNGRITYTGYPRRAKDAMRQGTTYSRNLQRGVVSFIRYPPLEAFRSCRPPDPGANSTEIGGLRQ